MRVIENTTGPSAGFEAGWWRKVTFRLSFWWYHNVSRRIPRLVWIGQDVDVHVEIGVAGLEDQSIAAMWIWEAQKALHEAGLSFDSGSGLGGRDWEWDYSLKGPITVKFKSVHKGTRHPLTLTPKEVGRSCPTASSPQS